MPRTAPTDGIRKLDAIIRQNVGIKGRYRTPFPVVTALTSEQLDLALGRSNVIHAALLAGPASETFLSRCQTPGPIPDGGRRQDGTATRPRIRPDQRLCGRARRNRIGTAEWLIQNTPGDKKLSVPDQDLDAQAAASRQGTVRQSFSHGRTKQVVVEKRGKRRVGGERAATETHGRPNRRVAKRAAPRHGTAAGAVRAPPPAAPRSKLPAWCCAP